MGTYIHIAEIAALLFVAYLAGWLVGYVARRIAVGAPQPAAVIPATRLASVTDDQPADALVKAPVVVPVSDAPPPALPAMAIPIEPVKARITADGAVLVEAPPIPQPEPVSGIQTLKALSATMPLMAEAAPPFEDAKSIEPAEPLAETATVVPASAEPGSIAVEPPAFTPAEPISSTVEPAASLAEAAKARQPAQPVLETRPLAPAMPASVPGIAWSGAINGHEAAKFEPPSDAAEPAPAALQLAADTQSDAVFALVAPHDELPIAMPDLPDGNPSAGLDVALLTSMAAKLELDQPRPGTSSARIEMAAPAANPPEPESTRVAVAVQPEQQPPAAPAHVEFDEGAAMRAIEGGWSRKASRALPGAPELTDVSAAVSAAQMAVEQVLALNGLDVAEADARVQAAFGKPRGLSKPRDGGRDDLKQIHGLSPLDESTLNNLGIFHFDQIALWDEREVLWMENHAFARGRIGREAWQAQARDLDGRAGGVRASR